MLELTGDDRIEDGFLVLGYLLYIALLCMLAWFCPVRACCFDISAMINSLGHQGFPTATSPSTRSVPLTTSPGPVDTFIAQDGLGYIQATSPQPTGFALNTAVSLFSVLLGVVAMFKMVVLEDQWKGWWIPSWQNFLFVICWNLKKNNNNNSYPKQNKNLISKSYAFLRNKG